MDTREFLIESQKGLDRMERRLTDLEKRPDDAALIAEIFRSSTPSRAKQDSSDTNASKNLPTRLVRFRVPQPGSQPVSWREGIGNANSWVFAPKLDRAAFMLMSGTTRPRNARDTRDTWCMPYRVNGEIRCTHAEERCSATSKVGDFHQEEDYVVLH